MKSFRQFCSENYQLDETPKVDKKIMKDAKPLKGGGLYKTDQSKKDMGDRGVSARRNMRNAMIKSGVGSRKPEVERADRLKDHKASRGVKTKGGKAGHSGNTPKYKTFDDNYPHKKKAEYKNMIKRYQNFKITTPKRKKFKNKLKP